MSVFLGIMPWPFREKYGARHPYVFSKSKSWFVWLVVSLFIELLKYIMITAVKYFALFHFQQPIMNKPMANCKWYHCSDRNIFSLDLFADVFSAMSVSFLFLKQLQLPITFSCWWQRWGWRDGTLAHIRMNQKIENGWGNVLVLFF